MMTIERRQMLLGSAGLAASLALPTRGLAKTSVMFRIWRKGEDIGRHEVIFDPASDGLHVTSFVDIKVKIAFLTAFSFEQEAEDHWSDGVLVRSRVRTDDDGEKSLTEMVSQQDSVVIDGPKGMLEAPKGIMTDVCFWNPDIVGQQHLLDTGKGEIHPVSSTLIGEETVLLPQGRRRANRYRVESAGGRSGDIWFDLEGDWVDANLTTRGENLDYERL